MAPGGTLCEQARQPGCYLSVARKNSLSAFFGANAHREELAAMVRRIYNDFKPRDWADVAADFESICLNAVGNVEQPLRK